MLEAARNIACVGARPVALVNCLNFGNPEHPEVMWQFTEVVDGMSEACTALSIPVVGGNVSFYNESLGRDIDPTPVVGLLGHRRRARRPPAARRAHRRDAHRRARRDGARGGRVRMGRRGPRPRRRDATARRHRRRARGARARARARVRRPRRRRPRLRRRRSGGHAGRDGNRRRVRVRRGRSAARSSASRSRRRVSSAPSTRCWSTRCSHARAPPAFLLPTSARRGVTDSIAAGAFDVALTDATRAWRDAIPNALGAEAAAR